MNNTEEFRKIIDDFTKDLLFSYPEYESAFNVIDYDEYYSHCEKLYPENFFNILYENSDLYCDSSQCCLLPNIDFKIIFEDKKLSDDSKKMIWKYLQLILFCLCKGLKNGEDFGDANYLFQAINEEDLQTKIQETMNEMKDIFFNENMDLSLNMDDIDLSNEFMNNFEDSSSNMFDNMMNEDELKEHLNNLMNGNIGKLAKEIADEATEDFGLDDLSGEGKNKDPKVLLETFFKNPTKLLNIVKNIGTKLEDKIKKGDIKESELLEEAQEIMSKMKDMPGVKNMMSSMGLGGKGGNFDMKGMMNKMSQNMKQSKMKERMQDKLKKNKERSETKTMNNMTQVDEETFIWNDSNSNPKEPLTKSGKKASKGNKKKKKKKKN